MNDWVLRTELGSSARTGSDLNLELSFQLLSTRYYILVVVGFVCFGLVFETRFLCVALAVLNEKHAP